MSPTVHVGHRRAEQPGQVIVDLQAVVERTVRLHVGHDSAWPRPRRLGRRADLNRATLGASVASSTSSRRRPKPSRSLYDGCAPMAHAVQHGEAAALGDRLGVSGMESARDVGARDEREQRVVIADALAEIAVEIDGVAHAFHSGQLALRGRRPADWRWEAAMTTRTHGAGVALALASPRSWPPPSRRAVPAEVRRDAPSPSPPASSAAPRPRAPRHRIRCCSRYR